MCWNKRWVRSSEIRTCETSVYCNENAWYYIPEGWNLHTRRRENLKSNLKSVFLLEFIIVFWDVLPCKIIVDRRFRGTCCLNHKGWWTQHVRLKRRTKILKFILAAVRTWNLISFYLFIDLPTFLFFLWKCILFDFKGCAFMYFVHLLPPI
jgi:hypothetical protein